MEELPQVTFRETWETRMVWNHLSLGTGCCTNTDSQAALEKRLCWALNTSGDKKEEEDSSRAEKATHHPWEIEMTPIIHHLPQNTKHHSSLGLETRLHTSEYLKSSARFIPSVWRTNSFSPPLLVLSLSRHRVMPFTSWITVLRARDASSEERSKYTLVSGNAKET